MLNQSNISSALTQNILKQNHVEYQMFIKFYSVHLFSNTHLYIHYAQKIVYKGHPLIKITISIS